MTGHVAEQRGVVEAGVEALGERQLLGYDRIGRQQPLQRHPVVRGSQGVALDDAVGVLARQAAALDESHQSRDDACRPRPRSMFSRIRSGPNDEAVDERGGPDQHVVEQDRGVGQRHPLRVLGRMSRSCHNGWFSRPV